jgi:FlaA1/EpsC-like NDP-sugar epimerase
MSENSSFSNLLFRESVELSDAVTDGFYKDKTVLVTGCGTIGSALMRRVAALKPKRLIGLDIYENNLYEIQQELLLTYGDALELHAEVGSVRDRERVEEIFEKYRPQIVFHAAAHKHVPLMEHTPREALKNNVFGTLNVCDMAEKYSAERFILISTDKAVNPTGVMGATKRLCEKIIQSRIDSKTTFAAVRFGNVLGSNGSVVPLFKRQIETGGPITVTDKRMTRFFMTVSEAAQLVMCAGAMAKGGELFVLDMGQPVRIIDLAESLIRSYGYEPYKDIEIIETGLRPGERLYEELLVKSGSVTKTDNGKIFIENEPTPDRSDVENALNGLKNVISEDENAIITVLKRAVPEYI